MKKEHSSIKLSFVLACYNVEKYISRTVESIFKDIFFTAETVEVIAINDGSTDATLEKLHQLEKKYPISVIHQENKGVGLTKNKGLEEAKGEYVMILDADDWIDAEVVSKLLTFSLKNDIDLMAFEMQYVNEQNEFTHLKNIFPGPHEKIVTGKQVLLNGYTPSSVCLFLMHHKFFNEYGMRFYNGTQLDVELSTRLMLKAEKVYFSNQVGYYYFRNEGSITKATSIKKLKCYLKDSIRVATLGKENFSKTNDSGLKKILIQNNNSIVWNLIWRFVYKSNELDSNFKNNCIKDLKKAKLYPIKGPLKTKFQKLSTLFFNLEFLLKIFFRISSTSNNQNND